MTDLGENSGARHQFHTLRKRLRELGIVLVRCSPDGSVNLGDDSGDWLASLFGQSGLVQSALRTSAKSWVEQTDIEPTELFHGCWAIPVPIMSRRKRVGYSVAIIPTGEVLEAEELHGVCQSAQRDYRLSVRLLSGLPPAAVIDVPRIAALVRFAHEDQFQLACETSAIEVVGQQLAESYEEISLLYSIIQSMTVVERPERFVQIVCKELLETLPYAWIGAQLADDAERLRQLAGRLFVVGDHKVSVAQMEHLTRKLLEIAEPERPMVLEPRSNPAHAQFADLGETALAHPASRDGRIIGLLIAGDKLGTDTVVTSVDMKLLGASASHMGIFLENAALYDNLNAMFLGTLEALTTSIDAKDRYTCGHSQRVAMLSRQLAMAAGLDEHIVQRVRIAGLVHDVGKIGVPESVLCKPGALTDEEYATIQQHPAIGYRILRDIPQLQDVLPGVLYHHERWDGKGYPEGLSGEDIPLFARLIALADSFDAMSSNRHYRSAMTRSKVLKEVEDGSGTQFDPNLAPVFLTLDFGEFDRLVAEHRVLDKDLSISRGEAA